MKKLLLTGAFTTMVLSSNAQKLFGSMPNEIKTEIEGLYVPVIAIGALLGMGGAYYFTMTGENKDLMKFIKICIGIAAAAVLIGSIYSFITSQSLS